MGSCLYALSLLANQSGSPSTRGDGVWADLCVTTRTMPAEAGLRTMRVLKHFAVNLAVLAFLVAVMVPAGLAEGQLGDCSLEAITCILSAVMTIVSSLAYGIVGIKSAVVVRCVSVVVVLWFLLSLTMFMTFEKPAIIEDVAKYWIGAIVSVALVVLQGIYNRKSFLVMLGAEAIPLFNRHQCLAAERGTASRSRRGSKACRVISRR